MFAAENRTVDGVYRVVVAYILRALRPSGKWVSVIDDGNHDLVIAISTW
jgi:hypothetical protein